MGITLFSKSLIGIAVAANPDIKSVIELGSQNDYTSNAVKPPFANGVYKEFGINDYTCIDLAGDNYAIKYDLGKPITTHTRKYDLVTDFGTSEHVVLAADHVTTPFHDDYIHSVYPTVVEDALLGYYSCWLNKHNLCKIGGIIISENPLTGNWPNHGYAYLGKKFYHEFKQVAGYENIMEGLEPAMGNSIDGWNIWAVLRKVSDEFPTFEQFKELPIFSE